MKDEKEVAVERFGRWQVTVTIRGEKDLLAYFYDCATENGWPRYTGASYYVETLLGLDGFAKPISEIAALSLNLSVPEWTVTWEDLQPLSDLLTDLYADFKLGRL